MTNFFKSYLIRNSLNLFISMYDTFDIEQDSHFSANNSPIKTRTDQYNDRYMSNISKNFLSNEKIENQEGEPISLMKYNSGIEKSGVNENVRERRKHRRNQSIKLQPLSKIDKIEVFKNVEKTNKQMILDIQDEDIQDIVQTQTKSKREKPSKPEQRTYTKKNLKDIDIILDSDDQVKVSEQLPDKSKINFLFEDEEIIHNTEQPEFKQDGGHTLPVFYMHSESSQNQVEPTIINKTSQYFIQKDIVGRRGELMSYVERHHVLRMELHRDNSGFSNTFWPEFKLTFNGQSEGVIHAKRITARPISTFIVSLQSGDFQESSNNYMGKMKSNAMGDILNIFGAGLSPKMAKQKGVSPRQLLATIAYQTAFFQSGKPRQFYIYIKRRQSSYYNDFVGQKMYDDEIGYDQLYRKEHNRANILLYKNKKPVWNDKIGGFMLNFRGRVSCSSIKNFIVQDHAQKQAILFGKSDQNLFNLQISDNISPFVAFCIALSSFDSKIICE